VLSSSHALFTFHFILASHLKWSILSSKICLANNKSKIRVTIQGIQSPFGGEKVEDFNLDLVIWSLTSYF